MMKQEKFVAGFIGTGGIARSHVFALNSLKYYYANPPDIILESACSATAAHRESFAGTYGFNRCQTPEAFFRNERIDTVFILSPNKFHFDHLNEVIKMPGVTRIYLEKPVCSTVEEEMMIEQLVRDNPGKKIQVGFQYLFSTNIREALGFWKTGKPGRPFHFDVKYYHGDYLRESYRSKRRNRLTPAPDGGAMADLGSHAISLLVAFLGENLQITSAIQAGDFPDVPADSDLFSLINIFDPATRSAGTVAASRITSGSGDLISFELAAENGTLKFSTHKPTYFEYFMEETGQWQRTITGSNYGSAGSFPSAHVPPGWLRSMIHAHYVFLTGEEAISMVPGIEHGLAVQRLVRETAANLVRFRDQTGQYVKTC